MKKFTTELKKHCDLKELENIYNKYKKIKGKSIMVWFGIKQIKDYF